MNRKGQAEGVLIQERDLSLLRGLFESRIMTAAHIAALYFDGKREAAKKRLQKLKTVKLIGERPRRVNEPSILYLTINGHLLLAERDLISDLPQLTAASFEKRARVSPLTIHHELEVMDVKAAFHSALLKSTGYSIAEFSTWPRLHEFRAKQADNSRSDVLVKPDGFIRIQEKEAHDQLSEHTFFLEVDRSSETQTTLVNRAAAYLNYYRSGGFADKNGAERSEYKAFPFRVLIVLKNAERRNNTSERLLHLNPPILTFVYLTTLSEVTTDPLGAIWVRPVDYRNILSEHQLGERPIGRAYKRQSKVDSLIEREIKKSSLLEEK
jgi:hypothetical protein